MFKHEIYEKTMFLDSMLFASNHMKTYKLNLFASLAASVMW